MANPSVTNTFVNGNTADAGEVNQNFSDIINALTDGTKDLSISALTCAGSATLNGNVTLGNGSGDDITITGSIAGHVVPKTTGSYNLGSTSLGYIGVYQSAGASYTFSWLGSGSATASYTLTVPTATGVVGQGLVVSSTGVLSWKPLAVDTSAKSDAYVITDSDGIRTVLVTTGGTGRIITLPTAADNPNRIITVKKVDTLASATDIITLKSDAAGETIDGVSGTTGIPIAGQYSWVTVHCDGSDWHVIGRDERWPSYDDSEVTIGSSGLTGLSITRAIFVPYQTMNGIWRMTFNLVGTHDSDASYSITLNGVAFKTGSSQPLAWSGGSASITGNVATASDGSGNINVAYSAARTDVRISGDVELDSKPTFATKR